MKLQQAFDISRGDVVAFVGAGGKTSLLIGLGYELAEAGWRVLATTSASLRDDQLGLFPRALPCDADARSISQALSEDRFVLLYDEIRRGRVYGPALEWTPLLLDSVDSDVLLVEADDAGGLPFKAPLDWQPQIPLETSLVVPVASLEALGKPLDDEHIYNPQALIERFGFVRNSPVKSPWLAQALRDDKLGLKNVPDNARVVIYLNRTPDRGYLRGRARMIARLCLQSDRVGAVALGSVRAATPVHELQRAIGAIIIANAQQQPPSDKGKSAIFRVGEQLIRSRIDHIRVVAGLGAREIRQNLKPLGLRVISRRAGKKAADGCEPDQAADPWQLQGESLASLKAGLRALPAHVAATLIVPGQQARLQPKVVYQLLSAFARGAGDIIVPSDARGPGFPLLIARRCWADLASLPRKASLGDMLDDYSDRIAHCDVKTGKLLPKGEAARLVTQKR